MEASRTLVFLFIGGRVSLLFLLTLYGRRSVSRCVSSSLVQDEISISVEDFLLTSGTLPVVTVFIKSGMKNEDVAAISLFRTIGPKYVQVYVISYYDLHSRNTIVTEYFGSKMSSANEWFNLLLKFVVGFEFSLLPFPIVPASKNIFYFLHFVDFWKRMLALKAFFL